MAEIVETKRDELTGLEYHLYDDGSQRYVESGQMRRPPDRALIKSSEKGREMNARRYELARQKADEALDEAAGIETAQRGKGEGWKRIVKHTAKTMLESKNLRGMGEVLSKLGAASGNLGPEGSAQQPVTNNALFVGADVETLLKLLELLEDRERAEREAQYLEANEIP